MAKRAEAPTSGATPDAHARQTRGASRASLWRGSFASPRSSLWLAAQRLGRTWRLLLAVELGMVIAVALLATAPFYSDLVAGAQIQNTLATSASPDRNIQVDVTINALDQANLPAIDQIVSTDVQHTVAPILADSTEYLQTTRPLSLVKVNGAPVATALPEYPAAKGAQDLPMAFDYSQAAPHMKLLSGRLPRDVASSAPPEVMVTPAMGVAPGAMLHLVDAGYPKSGFDARVVGVWFPNDERDPFWNGLGFDTIISTLLNNPPPPQYPVLFTRGTLVQLFSYPPSATRLPMGMGLHYIYFVAQNRITAGQARTLTQQVTALRTALDTDVPGAYGASLVDVATRLGELLAGATTLLAVQALPLYSVDAQLVTLALLFIFALAGLLVESQAEEIATLKSRGASMTQLTLMYLAQGVLLGGIALVVGMAAAGGLALTLVRAFVPLSRAVSDTLTPAYAARAVSLSDALTPALVGAALAIVALTLAAWQAARLDALAFRREQGRGASVPFWKRYYLDIGLAILCGAAYLELATFGGLGARTQIASDTGSQSVSPADIIQSLAPTLLLLAGALLLQRVTPWLLRLGAWLTARGRGATGMLAFAQVSRASASFNRLTLLLTLAVGLGLFSLTFQTTLAQSAHDNAYYLTGADERLVIEPQSQGTQSTLGYAAKFARMPGVEQVTPLYRGIALTLPNQGGQNVNALGVDPATFAQTATWRSDYASQSLPSLMRLLAQSPQGASVGEATTPMVALIDQAYATAFQLQVGQHFQLSPQEVEQADTSASVYFVVGAIVNDFPTLYDQYPTGYIIVNINNYLTALANPNLGAYAVNGPNEFLLRVTGNAQAASARAQALADPNFFVASSLDARALTTSYRSDPLVAGMSGLLLLGALLAALLALVGVLAQAGVATQRRQTQFAILRTLGLPEAALTRMLLLEQALVYLLGALGGVAIGALLVVASLPFLGFSTSTYTPPVIGVPPTLLAFNLAGSAVYLAALLLIFALALIVAAALAHTSGLGRALRVGED